ncbi:hypothetical protein PQ744_13120 [Thermoanaerobacterium thermosaccharolyticum]|uniref:hypothetical protein n=1 Tax=Thermoanaerobacterium thermosaccharolyticum TaxID=1517 RepID=UPI003D27933F
MYLNSRLSKIYNYHNYEYFNINTDINKIFRIYSKLKMTEKNDEYIDIYNDFYCNYDTSIDENKSSDEEK